MIPKFIKIAERHGLALHESQNGVIVEFPPTKGFNVLLISTNDGYSWTPEARYFDNDGKSCSAWAGRFDLQGVSMTNEIIDMLHHLEIPDLTSIVIQVYKELQECWDGKIIS